MHHVFEPDQLHSYQYRNNATHIYCFLLSQRNVFVYSRALCLTPMYMCFALFMGVLYFIQHSCLLVHVCYILSCSYVRG